MTKNLIKIFGALFLTAFISKIIFLAFSDASLISLLSSDGLLSLAYGTRFDATASAALSIPIILLVLIFNFFKFDIRPLLKGLMVAAAFWLILTTMSDTIYAEEARKHVTYELITASGSEFELIKTAFLVYYKFLVIGFVLCLIALISIRKLPLSHSVAGKAGVAKFGLVSFIWLLLTVTFIRGGWFDAPQSPMSTYKIGNNDKAYIAWSAPYSITYYLAIGNKKAATRITQSPKQDITADLQQALKHDNSFSADSLKKMNIVFVLLESWVSIDMKSYGSEVDATPFFDSLKQTSLSSRATYADGYRTVQGMYASMCSAPNPNGGIVAGTQLQNNQYGCLPQMLNQAGWDTRFVQGSGKGIVGAFAQSLGFEKSYGKEDYDFDFEMNEWGYLDDGIYKFSLERIEEMQSQDSEKPFFIMINTGTTHGTILPNESDYEFGRDNMVNLRRSIMKYADGELERFITQLNDTLTEPTLVVLMSDHTAKIVEPNLARNSIPFLMYATDGSVPARHHDASTSQRDVGATILDSLGGSASWFTGQSLLEPEYHNRSSFSNGSTYFWIDDQRLITIDSTNGELQRCYNIDDNTIKLHKTDCNEEWAQPLYEQGRDFNELTQELLFNGKTMDYRKLESIFPEQ